MGIIDRIKYRLKQFNAALNSKLNHSDVEFIRHYLTKAEQVLLYQSRTMDQKHSILVAHKCLEKSQTFHWVDKDKMVKAALLHDVGKSYLKISILSRSLYVIFNAIRNGKLMDRLASKDSPISLFKYFYVLQNHGEMGARLLKGIDEDESIVNIVRNHHSKPRPGEDPILPVLREIDNGM